MNIAYIEKQSDPVDKPDEIYPKDLVIDDTQLKKHALIVMEALGSAVESLDDSIFLSNILVAIGQQHCKHNVSSTMIGVSYMYCIRNSPQSTVDSQKIVYSKFCEFTKK